MELRDYQKEISDRALNILKGNKIVYLAMQTRTGKTATSLNIANLYNSKSLLFITKKKAIKSIEKDYNAMNLPYSITVINYESAHKVDECFDLVILDEAHALGQYPKPSNRAKKLKKLIENKPIIYLSATPTPESYSQLYHQFYVSSFSPFKEYKTFYKWANDFVNKKQRMINGYTVNDYSNAKGTLIFSKCSNLFITFSQKDAGFKQEVNEKVISVEMPDKVKNIIKTVRKDKVYLSNDLEIIADTPVKEQGKVHQLCSGTVMDENGYKILSTHKVDAIKEKFKNKKIAIFYKFKSEFEMLKANIENYTTDPVEFNQDNDSIYLGQFISSREGIRLDKADAIIFFNIDFSFLSYEQARNRIASFERSEPATLYWLFSKGGIEEKIYKAVMRKEDYTLSHYNNEGIEI